MHSGAPYDGLRGHWDHRTCSRLMCILCLLLVEVGLRREVAHPVVCPNASCGHTAGRGWSGRGLGVKDRPHSRTYGRIGLLYYTTKD